MLVLVETEVERVFTEDELEFARGFGEQAALAIHNAQLFEDMKGMHLGNLRALSSALSAKDFYTIGHTARVAAYAVLLAEELHWTPRAVQQLEEATYLHDIGKIAVSDRVAQVGPADRRGVGAHAPAPGGQREIIESLLDEGYVAGVRHHHERWDGGGTRTGWPGRRSPWWRGCSAWWTGPTPCRRGASTARRSPTASASPSWSAAPARSSTPVSWRRSCACSSG